MAQGIHFLPSVSRNLQGRDAALESDAMDVVVIGPPTILLPMQRNRKSPATFPFHSSPQTPSHCRQREINLPQNLVCAACSGVPCETLIFAVTVLSPGDLFLVDVNE